jgi:hypothetical protein
MNSEDATSPSVSGPSKENTLSPEVNNHTTTHVEPLSFSLTREFDAVKDLIKENRKTRLKELTSNPAVLVILTFVFTLFGTNLTSSLAIYQQQRAAERSFIDESNKLRIQKIGEVWEQLDQDEYTIDRLLEADDDIVAKFPTPNDRAKEIETIIGSDRAMVSKSRFWLGKDISEKINNYLNANIRYSIKKLAGTSEADLKADKAARDAAKSDVDQIREELLRGVPQSRT